MKDDRLEKFITENRQDFDTFEPNEQVWDGVLQSVKPVRKLKWTTIALRVAAVVVIFIASYFFHDLTQQNSNTEISEEYGEQPNEQMQMLLEAEVFYTSQIKTAQEEFFRLSGDNKELMDDINSDLKELDKVFEELKNDLRDEGDNQEVIEAMVQNYRIKLQILEDMLGQMNKAAQTKNKTNEHEI
jgi:CHASE3 domain sensor protein